MYVCAWEWMFLYNYATNWQYSHIGCHILQIEMVLKEESDNLKRKSMDIDRQYAEYLEEKNLFEQQKLSFVQENVSVNVI